MCLDQWIEIGKIVAPLLALLGAWWMWLYDQRKRHDPLKQEVYRQRIADYRSLLQAMGDVIRLVQSTESVLKCESHLEKCYAAYQSLEQCLGNQIILMHEDVYDAAAQFRRISAEIHDGSRKNGQIFTGSVEYDKYQERLRRAANHCAEVMRNSLDVEHADIDFAEWGR